MSSAPNTDSKRIWVSHRGRLPGASAGEGHANNHIQHASDQSLFLQINLIIIILGVQCFLSTCKRIIFFECIAGCTVLLPSCRYHRWTRSNEHNNEEKARNIPGTQSTCSPCRHHHLRVCTLPSFPSIYPKPLNALTYSNDDYNFTLFIFQFVRCSSFWPEEHTRIDKTSKFENGLHTFHSINHALIDNGMFSN